MQRPRRTSEFQEEQAGIRKSRTQRSTFAPSPLSGAAAGGGGGGGTAKKYANRQSRIAVPQRTSSQERAAGTSLNPYLTVPTSCAKARGVTPQKTPLAKPTANRVLFTAEKQRPGTGGNAVALHNDKKWIQEQTQRITEHLLTQNTLGAGISTDFLNRGLRQMSIKQFVAIINYFLSYIWGNRFTVGTNHVDDIISILQKLHYPHPINKSWLKTPNTQHSFGNVIVLFDFLMDFVPTAAEQDSGYGEILVFDLKEPEIISNSRLNDDLCQIPDLEFQQELLKHSEEGFLLWDKQKDEELDALQQQTCNLFIQKTCGVPDAETLDLEIQKLEDILRSLEKERPPEDKDDMKKKSNLSHELKKYRRDIKALSDDCEHKKRDLKDINSLIKATTAEVECIEKDIKSLQTVLAQQKCSVEQRDQLVAEMAQYKQMLAVEQRTIQDLQERNLNNQIKFSRTLKQFTDLVEAFNERMREIKFSDLKLTNYINNEDLELSLRPSEAQLENLDKIKHLLQKIQQKIQKRLQENKASINLKQQHCKELLDDIQFKLQPQLNELHLAFLANNKNLETFLQHLKAEETKLSSHLQQVENELIQAVAKINELELLIKQKSVQLEEQKLQNERCMVEAEEKHKLCVQQRRNFLLAYDKMLDESIQSNVLQQLKQQVELQEKQLQDLKKDLE